MFNVDFVILLWLKNLMYLQFRMQLFSNNVDLHTCLLLISKFLLLIKTLRPKSHRLSHS